MTKRDIYGCLDIPDADRETAISEREGQYLYDLVHDHEFSATLEVGLAWGASAAFILAAGAKCHIAIDPFQEKDYGDQGLRNLSKLKLTQRLVHVCDLSARALPRLWAEGRTLDFAFIDGGHRFAVPMEGP